MPVERKIVLVDDKASFRSTTKMLLRKIGGCTVTSEYASGEDFLKNIKKIDAEIVFMDIEMPGINGIETTQRALQIRPKLIIIGLSLYDEPKYIQKLIEVGARGYLLKLADNLTLIETIIKYPTAEIFYSKEITSQAIPDKSLKRKIIILEESESTRFIIDFTLQNRGYEVYTFDNVENTLKATPTIVPDIIIADYNTIDKSLNFFKTIHAIYEASHAEFILLNDTNKNELITEAHQYGIKYLLKKPFTGNQLLQLVEQVIYNS